MGSAEATAYAARPWRWPARVGFRFAFAYFTLFAGPNLLAALPGSNYAAQGISWATDSLARWSARAIFGIEDDLGRPNGSGDRLLNYIEFFDLFVLAAIVTVVWSLVDWRRPRYRYLPDILRVVVRYALAVTLLSYGWAKVFSPRQFPEPDVGRLMQPYGESSPMGLLWTFMGASQPYTIFGGIMEVIPGLLLLFRRTALAGSLLAIAVMGNIVVMNFCYDVPVKLYSMHYLAMAFWIALWDGRRLAKVFLLNRPVPADDLRSPLPAMRPGFERAIRITLAVVKVAVVLSILGLPLYYRWQFGQTNASAVATGLDGGYIVERFERDGEVLPPLAGDGRRWRSVGVFGSSFASVRTMDGGRIRFNVTIDAEAGTLTLKPIGTAGATETWSFAQSEGTSLDLNGKLDGHALKMRLKKADREQYLLVNRGFHWINDMPFNR